MEYAFSFVTWFTLMLYSNGMQDIITCYYHANFIYAVLKRFSPYGPIYMLYGPNQGKHMCYPFSNLNKLIDFFTNCLEYEDKYIDCTVSNKRSIHCACGCTIQLNKGQTVRCFSGELGKYKKYIWARIKKGGISFIYKPNENRSNKLLYHHHIILITSSARCHFEYQFSTIRTR